MSAYYVGCGYTDKQGCNMNGSDSMARVHHNAQLGYTAMRSYARVSQEGVIVHSK